MTGPADAKTVQQTDALEVSPGFAHEKLEGWVPELAGEEEVRQALEKAFDYRGDVTITRKDGSKVEGYIFDRLSVRRPRHALVSSSWLEDSSICTSGL